MAGERREGGRWQAGAAAVAAEAGCRVAGLRKVVTGTGGREVCGEVRGSRHPQSTGASAKRRHHHHRESTSLGRALACFGGGHASAPVRAEAEGSEQPSGTRRAQLEASPGDRERTRENRALATVNLNKMSRARAGGSHIPPPDKSKPSTAHHGGNAHSRATPNPQRQQPIASRAAGANPPLPPPLLEQAGQI